MPLAVGNVVRFRNRVWRVDAVTDADFTATPLDGRDARRWRFIRSLEESHVQDGAFPQPDHNVISSPDRQDLLLRAHRLGMIHGSAPFLGLQRSRAIPEPYQLVPLLVALNQPRVRLLIGDDVGIGKSIEAGLILSELMARGSVERVLLLLPASLRDQWQETLDRFFHIPSVIMSGENYHQLVRQILPGQSPWAAYSTVITSIDYAKSRTAEILQHKWDFVLVDEAHLSQRPHAWGSSSLQKDRWDLLKSVGESPNVKHVVLLTATPHPGHTDAYASLLEVLNPQLVEGETIRRDLAKKHIVQRRRDDIRAWFGRNDPFPDRVREEPIIPLTDPEKSLLAELRTYGDTLLDSEGRNVGQWVSLHLQRRALSSPGSIQASLRDRLRSTQKVLASNLQPATTRASEAEAVVIDLESARDEDDEERYRRLDSAELRATQQEVARLEALVELAKKVTAAKDGKLATLVRLLPTLLARHPANKRALVFTRYKDTLDYLCRELEKHTKSGKALQGVEIMTIHGEMNPRSRREVYGSFEKAEKAICIATDCISEGLDLQRGCAELIHYELPWNPNRLEQRNGRLDRYGQPEKKVGITTLVRQDELDVTMLEVLVKKAAAIRSEYGFCPVFFSSAKELKKLIQDFGRTRQQLQLSFMNNAIPGTDAEADAEIDITTKERLDRIRAESFYGQEAVRLPEVEKALQETYEAVGNPAEVEGFIRSALSLVRAEYSQAGPDVWKINLNGTRYADLADEHGALLATFSPKVAQADPELELLDLAHGLVRRMVEDIRHESLGTEDGRIACRGTKEVTEVTAVAQALARFVTQSDPPVLMEELVPVAFLPYGGAAVQTDPLQLIRAKPAPLHWSQPDLKELAEAALTSQALTKLIEAAVEGRRAALVERQKSLTAVAQDWAEGMDRVVVASCDLLTLTLLIPV